MEDHWYVATLIIQCRVAGQDEKLKTVDEQIRVLRALSDEAAFEKAMRLGKEEELSYGNSYGEDVFWEFIGLADLEYLDQETIEDGTEIKSRLFRRKQPSELARPKEQLTVFAWEQGRQHRRVAEGAEEV